jgi:sugar lactone lactonase YvrE
LAGSINGGTSVDGTGAAASFHSPRGIAIDSAGNLYVTEHDNHVIRKITPDGVVTTLAGTAGQSGSADGTGPAARFNSPQSIAVAASGNIYVTDMDNHTIRKITPAGVVTTFAGAAGQFGSTDGAGSAARFYNPYSIAAGPDGSLYVSDTNNMTVRKITSAGVVTTIAGTAGQLGSVNGVGAAARFENALGIAVDSGGVVYLTEHDNVTVRKITPSQ